MDDWVFNIEHALTLSTSQLELGTVLNPYLAKQIWNKNDRKRLLNDLAKSFLTASNKKDFINFAHAIGPIALDVLHRCVRLIKDTTDRDKDVKIREFGIVLGDIIQVNFPVCMKMFAVDYFLEHCPFFCVERFDCAIDQRPTKRPKMLPGVQLETSLISIAQIFKTQPVVLSLNWPLKQLYQYVLTLKDSLSASAIAAFVDILSIILQLPWDVVNELRSLMLKDSAVKYTEYRNCSRQAYCVKNLRQEMLSLNKEKLSHTKKAFTSSDFSDCVSVVSGVIIHNSSPVNKILKPTSDSGVVVTDSAEKCLHSLALAVANQHPVMILGQAGCGKTKLIKYFAETLMRKNLIEVQLGEGVDSKVLSGMYKCTVVSGEFEWQPGVLTQAVSNGDWILLEDIDKAPLDVVSLLLPLLENGTMKISGHNDINNETNSSSSEFRIFMTCRANNDQNSSSNPSIAKLRRHSRCIELDAMSDSDLKTIISVKFPKIKHLADKLLEIYMKLEDLYMELSNLDSRSCKRLTSARDLFRLCNRVHVRVAQSCSESELGQVVAMEAIDCLAASSMSTKERGSKIRSAFALLNLSSSNADYFCQSYRPEILFQRNVAKLGRVSLLPNPVNCMKAHLFALTRSSSILLERIACAVEMCEPTLLVGETGVGKTSSIQFLAAKLGRTLHIVNISQQSSSSDLLGAFKPVQPKHLVAPVRDRFEKQFVQTFSRQQNEKFLTHIQTCFLNKKYNDLLHLMMHCANQALKKTFLSKPAIECWKELSKDINDLKQQIKTQKGVAFMFVEGILAQAIRNGNWLLLDEINLASPETLDCLSGVLESDEGSVALLEIGDTKPIKRHPNFRIFAAMNPATDVGKRNLPNSIRSRFLEIFVPEPADDSDLLTIIGQYLEGRMVVEKSVINGVLKFYREVSNLSMQEWNSGIATKPLHSLRSLCRALKYVTDNTRMALNQALYEGLCLAFLTEIDHCQHQVITKLIMKNVIGPSKSKSVLKNPHPPPPYKYVTVEGYHIRCGNDEPHCDEKYIVTPYVKKNIKVLSRAVAYGKYPILIQGETSTGKTSVIHYLASLTGNKVFRINNHEHTDLQEYMGSYSSDENGLFFFQEGPLVTAMRNGHWIILDELNLAPTDILESLNRVLDDNRELFIPETQERVVAHPRFALFATQNPPGVYGGRKVLSRALRNRFIELHFGQIPSEEIKTILHKRCDLPMSRCKRLVSIMEELQEKRSASGIFAGKHSLITLRDLFRWAERYRRGHAKADSLGTYDWDQQLANDGFMLLAGRVRIPSEKALIKETIQKHLSRKIEPEKMFSQSIVNEILGGTLPKQFEHVVFTAPLRKMIVMLHRAISFDEPVLLVGETGCGKTTACQLVSALHGKSSGNGDLSIINCHSHTDASDFLGGLRPVRHSKMEGEEDNNKLFEWVDGPLVQAMLIGKSILVDEISLAEDSVLERLNSVLEPARMLIIPDRIGSDSGELDLTIQANTGFQFMATMNPGGDFGKKELSPALRNRLTEIWCTAIDDDVNDVLEIIKHNLKVPAIFMEAFSDTMVKFLKWFSTTNFGSRFPRSIRDIMKWVHFCNICCNHDKSMDPAVALIHGALLVFVDGVGSGISDSVAGLGSGATASCVSYILKLLEDSTADNRSLSNVQKHFNRIKQGTCQFNITRENDSFFMGPFGVAQGPVQLKLNNTYSFQAPSTSMNTFRLLRALQLSNPILLEGSPGIGKTSLVVALAKSTGHDVVRINLSEQTDMSDLLGADLPVEDGIGGQFSWRDGPLLTALKQGSWVVFDELNLACQSVLEGLNSVFDHRNEIFVPELGITFHVHSEKTRIFACQNPYHQGGGRKGLPKSFLNRFNQVYMEPLSQADMVMILSCQYPSIPQEVISKMVEFNEEVKTQVVEKHQWGHSGSPWEFNLRDMTRWCELLLTKSNGFHQPEEFVYLIYCERLQSSKDRNTMYTLFKYIFECQAYQPTCDFQLSKSVLKVGNALMRRELVLPTQSSDTLILPSMLHSMESLMTVLSQGWMAILTGGSGSGKSTLVKTLASLIGKSLRIFSVNSSMDATELLGGFEQMDFLKHISSVPERVVNDITEYCRNAPNILDPVQSSRTAEVLGVIYEVKKLKSEVSKCKDVAAALNCGKNIDLLLKNLLSRCQLGDLPDDLLEYLERHRVSLANAMLKIENSKGKFEWVDSELVEALKNGDWLLIEGANLCNPSVLDRLNALLEPGGLLSVTERGVIDGSFVEISPHTSFRLILSLDSSEGNLSRAMRNRGVEIHMLSQDCSTKNTRHAGAMSWDEVRKIVECSLSLSAPKTVNQVSYFLLELFTNIAMERSGSSCGQMLNCIKCAQEIAESLVAGNSVQSSLLRVCSKYKSEESLLKIWKTIEQNECNHTGEMKMPIVRLNNIIHDTISARLFYQGQFFDAVNEYCQQQKSYDALGNAAILYARLATADDWMLRMEYLSNFVGCGHLDVGKYKHALGQIFSSPSCENALSRASSDTDVSHMPWDPRLQCQYMIAFGVTLNEGMISTLNLLTLNFVNKLYEYELNQKLNAQAQVIQQQKIAGRKNAKKSRSMINRSTQQLGSLVLSFRYHSGLVKLQSLPDPGVVYIYPLYQSISAFISICSESQGTVQFSEEELNKTLEALSEMKHTWNILMSPSGYDATVILLLLRRIHKAVLSFSSCFMKPGNKNFVESYSKLTELFQMINRSYNTDWDTLRLQNNLRLLHGELLLDSVPCRTESDAIETEKAVSILIKINDALRCKSNYNASKDIHELVLKICKLHASVGMVMELSEEDVMTVVSSELETIESAVEKTLECLTNCDLESTALKESSTDADPSFVHNCSQSMLDMMLYSIVHQCLDLLRFWDSNEEESRIAVKVHIDEMITSFAAQNVLNARVLKQLFLVSQACQCAPGDGVGEKNVIVNHLLSVMMTLLCESSLSEIYPQKPRCLIGASILMKPYLSGSCINAIRSNSTQYQSTAKNEMPLDRISAASLRIWSDVSLPLSQYETMLNMLKSITNNLWNDSFTCSDSSMVLPSYEWLLRSCVPYFCYLSQELTLFARVNDIANSVMDATLHNVFKKLLQAINQFHMPVRFLSVLKSLTFACEQVLQDHVLHSTAKRTSVDVQWLEQIKTSLKNVVQCVSMLMMKLSCFDQNMSHLEKKKLEETLFLYLGMSWVWTSTFSLCLCSPQNDIDPLHIYDMKYETLKNQHTELWNEVQVYSMYIMTLTGRKVFEDGDGCISDEYLHPLLPLQYRRRLEIAKKLEAVKQKMAFRPQGNQIKKLVQHCKQTYQSFLSPENITKMSKELESIIQLVENGDCNFADSDINRVINAFCGIRSNLAAFTDKLVEFPAFPDFCTPLLDALNHFSLGCGTLENALKSLQALKFEAKHNFTYEEFFCTLVGIKNRPTDVPNMISFSKSLQEDMVKMSDSDNNAKKTNLVEDVVSSLLLRLRNIVLFEGSLSPHMQDLRKLLDFVVTEFDKQQEEESQKEKEKASLYKTKSHLENLTEEKLEEDEFAAIFGYRPGKDDTDSLTTMELSEEIEPETRPKYSDNLWKLAMQVHRDVTQLSGCALSENSSKTTVDLNIDLTVPCIYANWKLQPVFATKYEGMLNIDVDDTLLNCHLMSVKQFCDNFKCSNVESECSCNIYIDPLISEAKEGLASLQNISSYVKETLLREWPDNPVLLKIIEISNRISNFSVSSPLIRFVNGMEILLSSVQEWEKNACSSVSLQKFMDEISQLICKWRKLELLNWGRLIEDEFKKLSAIKPSLYFSLYRLMLGQFDESGMKDLVTQLENFMESSSLAQFCSRLDTIDRFWHHLQLIGQGESCVAVCLKNVHSYYSQFCTSVKERLVTVRKPIEKELKDLVAITKWSDRSFFALKESVEKTHRQLFKLIKKFSLSMKEKVQCKVLMQGSNSSSFCLAVSPLSQGSLKPPGNCKIENISSSSLLTSEILSKSNPLNYPLLNRLPKILKKLSAVGAVCMSAGNSEFENGTYCIENFVADIIDTAQNLKDAKPTTVAEKGNEAAQAKRVSEAKNIKLRKQKALTDLFKHLSEIGLSYKKGIIQTKDLTPQELLMTDVPAEQTNVHSSYSFNKVVIETTCDRAESDRDYFYSIISKWCSLNIASGNPHRDLNKSSLERCTGFIGHLMNISMSQRKLLSVTKKSSLSMKESLNSLNIISQLEHHCEQLRCKSFINDSTKLVDCLCLLMEEFTTWMNCCPKEESRQATVCDINLDQKDHEAMALVHGDSKWSRIYDFACKVMEQSFYVKSHLENIRHTLGDSIISKPVVMEAVETLLSVQSSFEKFDDACAEDFKESSHSIRNMPKMVLRCANFLKLLKNHTHKYKDLAQFEQLQNGSGMDSTCTEDILRSAETLVSNVLVAVQKIKKSLDDEQNSELDKHDHEGPILKSMHEKISDRLCKMAPEQMMQEVNNFNQLLFQNLPKLDPMVAQASAGSVLAVLMKYWSLLHSLQTSSSKTNRTTMKLCHVICGIFIQLCRDGYCTPEDVKEEVDDGDGAELEDAEEGGVGEGEGTNDVSDQIEDQEMLEDKPGEEQQDEGGDNNIEASENAVEMENDFEGKFDDDNQEQTDEKSDEEKEEDVEKQMGELGNEENQQKLDEQFWGSDEEEEEDDDDVEKSNEIEEKGKGADKSESELAAKDKDLHEEENSQEEEVEPNNEDQKDEKPFDDSQFDPTESDPYDNENKDAEKDDDNLNLPDEFNMDDEALDDNKEDEVDDSNLIEESDDDAITDEKDPEIADNFEAEEQLNEGEVDENEEGAEQEEVDVDAEEAIPAEESLSKDIDNTVCDARSEDPNQDSSKNETKNYDQDENKMPPPETKDDIGNEGLTPTNEFDNTKTQTSRMNKKEQDDAKEPPTKKREPKSFDQPSTDEPRENDVEKRLNIVDPVNSGNEAENMDDKEPKPMENDEYEHVHSPNASYDKKVFDSVDKEVEQEQQDIGLEDPNEIEDIDEMMDVDEIPENIPGNEELKNASKDNVGFELSPSEIHTDISKTMQFDRRLQISEEKIDEMRKELEKQLQIWRYSADPIKMQEALATWESYCNLTRPLAIELCEQLRLVLEPTQASQLKGDYRTGKRLNIRKMIPYIASGYRKDKIWLRRTKPNKRTYQVMLALDDSSSMVDNHSKQLAFESVAVISGALSSLEVGDFAICNFGEEVQLLQNFGETWSSKSGASVLTRCTFSQKKTKIAQFLDYSVDLFQNARRKGTSITGNISQLLLIISDGRGLYLEGRKRVLEAVAAIHKAGVFVAFIILDQPNHEQGSISDIKVPVFKKPGEMPEIHSYMRDFPFPFYAILRNINVLPQTLGEALRQWFVLVTDSD